MQFVAEFFISSVPGIYRSRLVKPGKKFVENDVELIVETVESGLGNGMLEKH